MRDNMKQLSNLNAQVLGISIDSHYSLKMWAESNNLNFPLLSDFNKEVAPLYDSLYDVYSPEKYNYKGVTKRSALIIGKDGFIKHIEICETTGHQPNYRVIEEVLKNLN